MEEAGRVIHDSTATAKDEKSSASMLVQLTTDGVPKLHCPVCNKALVSLNGYVKHVKKHEPPGGFFCRFCDERYCSDEELKRHLSAVHTTIVCRICTNTTFTSEGEYREHIRVQHNGIDRELYICDKCGAEYKTFEPYKRHLDSQCGTVKPFKCDQCSMTFITKYNLKQHKGTHSGERRYCCSYCGKNFLQKGRLLEHERSHTGEKPYKCDVCGKCFAHRESIVTHSSIHTGIRLVECRSCNTRFSCYSNLIKHRRTRPDTCGLPEFDPPKNRTRTRRSRIPPTLNPTSEIKVGNVNKIIKPDDLKREQETKTSTKKAKGMAKSATRTTRKQLTTKSSRKCKWISTLAEDEKAGVRNSIDAITDSDEEPLVKMCSKMRGCSTTWLPLKAENSLSRLSDSDEDCPDFDPANSENEADESFELPQPVKQEIEEIQSEDFEYNDANHYVEPDCNLKEECNIFNEKDKLLDVLLKIDVEVQQSDVTNPLETVKLETANDILDEAEVFIIEDKNMKLAAEEEEDVLAVKGLPEKEMSKCKILLEDITQRYPKLKEDQTIHITNLISKKQRKSKKLSRNINKTEDKVTENSKINSRQTKNPKRVSKLTQNELKKHLNILNREDKSWKCPHCIKIYLMRKPFEKHLLHDHKLDEKEIKEIFKKDMKPQLADQVFKCNVCDKIYLMEKRLLAHKNFHGPDGSLVHKCPCYCNLYFRTREEATAHAHKDHRDLVYCEICEKFMTGHESLKNHIKGHHGKKETRQLPRNLVCDKCGKKFSGRTSLSDHVRSDCGRMPLYQCNVCGKSLTTAGILKTHLLLHKDETPFQCDKCGKTFKVKAQYKSHLKTRHTDNKPFKCHLCPKEYPYRESLLTHMTVHTGIKRFLCNGCGKRFTCISNLQAHRKVHGDTCGQLPLNAKATQYMGVQKGNLLLGAKPEAGLEYEETNTLIAKEVLDRDMPMAQELNFPSEPSAPLATVPLNYAGQQPLTHLLLPTSVLMPHLVTETHSTSVYF